MAKNIAAKISQQTGQVKCTRRDYQTGVQKVYGKINLVFERVFHVPFEKALTTLPTLNIQMSKSTTEKKKEKDAKYYVRPKRPLKNTGRVHL